MWKKLQPSWLAVCNHLTGEAQGVQVSVDSFLNCHIFKVPSGCNLRLTGIPCGEVSVFKFSVLLLKGTGL